MQQDPTSTAPIHDEDLTTRIHVLSALAHTTRLRVYLDLLRALPEGKASGEIAMATGTPPTTMSAHLAVLERAGLASTVRRGKSVIYKAEAGPARRLTAFIDQALAR